MSQNRTAFRWAATALFAYGAVFIVLSIDLLVRVWSLRAQFPRFADVAALFFFELSRSAVAAGALALGAWLAWRRHCEPAQRALAVAIGFATVAFAKAAAFRAFPGRLQEQVAEWLLAHDVPRPVLAFLFGSPAWAAWLALAALVLFAARFPAPVTPDAIERSGRGDRAGMMAGAHLAGLDVGTLFRRQARRLVQRGWLAPLPLGMSGVVLAALHHACRGVQGVAAVALLVAGIGLGLAITLLRAAAVDADQASGERLRALRSGAVGAAALFLAAALAGLLPPSLDFFSAALLAVAPGPALYGVARAALPAPDQFVGCPPKMESTSPVM